MNSDNNKPTLAFTPIPLRARHDGWTAERQIAFIEALAESGCVEQAGRRVGRSESSAYKLRRRPCGAAFREVWDAAMDYALHRLEQDAISRSRHGVARPIFYKGEQVGEWRHYDERLTMFILRSRRPERYGKWIDRMLLPADENAQEDSAIRLGGGIERIEWQGDSDPDGDGNDDDDSGCEQDSGR